MQCPHCHNELPQGVFLKFCPYCAKELQTQAPYNASIDTLNEALNDNLNRQSHPKWKETNRICEFLSVFIAVLFLLCFFLPFVDIGFLGSFSGYELLAEVCGAWFHDLGVKEFVLFVAIFTSLVMWVIYFISGLTCGFSKSKYGCAKNYYLSLGVMRIIASTILFIWVYKEMDGYISAISIGPYFLLVLAVCELIVGIYSRYVYNHLPVPPVTAFSQPQQEVSPIATPEGTVLYDVVLTYMPKFSSLRDFNTKKEWVEIREMFGASCEIGASREKKDAFHELFTKMTTAMATPPVRIASAVGEPYAQLLSEKFREVGATVEIRPHTNV